MGPPSIWSGCWWMSLAHGDVTELKHFPHYCDFVRRTHRPLVNSSHRGSVIRRVFSLLLAWNGCWVNILVAADLRFLIANVTSLQRPTEVCHLRLWWGYKSSTFQDDVIKWKHFPRYWPFVGNSRLTGEFASQRPVTRSFDVFFDLRLNKRLSKQSWRRSFETPSRSLWRHCNAEYMGSSMACSL